MPSDRLTKSTFSIVYTGVLYNHRTVTNTYTSLNTRFKIFLLFRVKQWYGYNTYVNPLIGECVSSGNCDLNFFRSTL